MIEVDEQYIQPGMRLGLQPSDPERQRRLIRLSEIVSGVPPHPVVADNMARISTWGMYQNNKYGVCGPVSVANLYKIVSAYLGNGQVDFTDDEVFDLYRRSGNPGFDPATGADDKGVEMTIMLSELVKNGIGLGSRNVRPVAFAAVDAGNIEEMRAATALFGGVLWGANLQQDQEQQFTRHQTWDYVPGGSDWGGHATMTGAYSDSPNDRLDRMTTVTWASPVPCTNAFLRHSVQECYVVVWPENLGSRQFQDNVDVTSLARYYEDLTGKQLDTTARPTGPVAPSTPVAPSSAGQASAKAKALYASLGDVVRKANDWAREEGLTK